MRFTLLVVGTGIAACGILLGAVAAAAPGVVEPADRRTNWFAGREAGFGTVIRSDEAVAGRLVWVLAVANRTIASGAVDVRHPGGGAMRVDVGVAVPEGREGVTVEAEFATALVDAAGTRLGACSRRVRIFPDDPFAGRTHWLESLGITVVDPPGDTERILEAAGVPFTSVKADADISGLTPRLLIVGEGTSWIDHPGLPHALAGAAAGGSVVLCLAPRDGTMPLPGQADEPGVFVASKLILRSTDVVGEIDVRLDDSDWSVVGPTIRSRLRIEADGDAVVVRAGDGPVGWPWLEAGFAPHESQPSRGRIVVCGLGIMAHWEDTPAARYLLASLLERLTVKKPEAMTSPHVDSSNAAPPKENEQ